jgi:hypothetical protein
MQCTRSNVGQKAHYNTKTLSIFPQQPVTCARLNRTNSVPDTSQFAQRDTNSIPATTPFAQRETSFPPATTEQVPTYLPASSPRIHQLRIPAKRHISNRSSSVKTKNSACNPQNITEAQQPTSFPYKTTNISSSVETQIRLSRVDCFLSNVQASRLKSACQEAIVV